MLNIFFVTFIVKRNFIHFFFLLYYRDFQPPGLVRLSRNIVICKINTKNDLCGQCESGHLISFQLDGLPVLSEAGLVSFKAVLSSRPTLAVT